MNICAKAAVAKIDDGLGCPAEQRRGLWKRRASQRNNPCLCAFVCGSNIGSCICLKDWVLPFIASPLHEEQSCNKRAAKTEGIEALEKGPLFAPKGNLCECVLEANNRTNLVNDTENIMVI